MGIVAAYAVPHPPLIIPAVGRGRERAIQATIDAYHEVSQRIAEHDPDAVVVLSPHAPFFRDAFYLSASKRASGSMARFGAPDCTLDLPCDTELSHAIARYAEQAGIPLAIDSAPEGELDHAAFIPLLFLHNAPGRVQRAFDLAQRTDDPSESSTAPETLAPARAEIPFVRVGLALLPGKDHRAFGRCIARACGSKRVVIIASGDLSHKLKADGPYGFAQEGPAFDERIRSLFSTGALDELFELDEALCENAAECGLRSFQIMAGALEGPSWESELISYEGPFGVGYAVAAFEETDPFVALARRSVEGFVRSGRPIDRPSGLPRELTDDRAGAFVSLHSKGELRGCIGTIVATQPCLADEIIRNGVAAASEDPRFSPVRPEELDDLSYSVDVLGQSERVESPSQLDPAHYGVIVTKGWKRGLLLPGLEGIESADRQVAIAKRKAGIDPSDSDVELERFEVVRHERGGKPRARR